MGLRYRVFVKEPAASTPAFSADVTPPGVADPVTIAFNKTILVDRISVDLDTVDSAAALFEVTFRVCP